ncbi:MULTISPECIES: DUF3592 domain-containing protein [unclassified Streptomyces]|uniref:DUF3592 domain-containing protein n=1 Tax=unclassified Streptomyces TaxID=2593676 RepID=UPI002DDBE8CB|nr:DUF3592 domain-containing protein [Streptomyces sp. NBC_01237]WRZ70298.1 DUF3592 domain-containing protein [Streptomyces sp. NBC_01237]
MVIAVVFLVVSLGASVIYGRLLDRQLKGPQLRAAWAEGHTAEARCTAVRTEEGQDAEGGFVTYEYPTLEFRTADGRTISIEERQSRHVPAEGEFVTVHYSARNPEGATTRAASFGMLHARALITGVGAVLAVAIASALALMV